MVSGGVFVQRSVYRREDLHERWGGQGQGGISTPAAGRFIMLFTGGAGEAYGYRDRWADDGLFFYTGEGQRGDMSFLRGNRAVCDHARDGKDLHLFEYVRPGLVQYVGQMVCTGWHRRQGRDVDGNSREMIIFELAPIEALEDQDADEGAGEWTSTERLEVLRERALSDSSAGRNPTERLVLARERSRHVRQYVLQRAHGTCEGCGEPAPFRMESGRPYLEPHHIRRLSDGGPDDPRWVVALCPNCHRRAHYGEERREFNQRLGVITGELERGIR